MSAKDKSRSWKKPDWLTPEQVETVIVAFPDVYGRLLGKRMTYPYFFEHVLEQGTHVCDYLLTCNLAMETQEGFVLSNWEKGYGDFHLVPDLDTMRRLPWHEKTAVVLADLHHTDETTVAETPRAMLAKQIERLAGRGQKPYIGSELEFALFEGTYHDLAQAGYRDLKPCSDYFIDYHILQPGRDEDVLRRLRREMSEAGITVECSKGECGLGQHEVNLLYSDAMEMADRHMLYKAGARDIAAQQGKSITFMAKWGEQEAGNGFHLHTSLWDAESNHNLFWDAQAGGPSELFGQFLGGLLAYSRELTYFFAPTINSYKRYQRNSWAPTAIVCGQDNRTCGYRLVGSGNSLRIENRMPGADANPYLTFAATLAAGMRGVDEKLSADIFRGNAYEDESLPRLPQSLAEARDLLSGSRIAHEAFGEKVVEFYLHTIELEAQAYSRTVTDWEIRRYFEQI